MSQEQLTARAAGETELETAIFEEGVAVRGLIVRSANLYFREADAFTGFGAVVARKRRKHLPDLSFGIDPLDSGNITTRTNEVVATPDPADLSVVKALIVQLKAKAPGTGYGDGHMHSNGNWGNSPIDLLEVTHTYKDSNYHETRNSVMDKWPAYSIYPDQFLRTIQMRDLDIAVRTEAMQQHMEEIPQRNLEPAYHPSAHIREIEAGLRAGEFAEPIQNAQTELLSLLARARVELYQ